MLINCLPESIKFNCEYNKNNINIEDVFNHLK